MAEALTYRLCNTFGTPAIARAVPPVVSHAQMAHANIQTTTATDVQVPMRHQADELGEAFS